jgi:hypothetical protein
MAERVGPGVDADPARPVAGAWHALLLRMAGALPDDLVSEAREWLAAGETADVAQAVAFAALTGRIPLLGRDVELITTELVADGQDPESVPDLEVIEDDVVVPLPWTFAPVRGEGPGTPVVLDLSTDPAALAALDPIDAAAVAAATADPAATALWRAWRTPADGAPWPAPRRVFVLTVPAGTTDDEPVRLAARVQAMLVSAGESAPQVEVCPEGGPVPAYQGTACAHAALLWAAEPPVTIRLARVFDSVDPHTGPAFDPRHPRIDDQAEAERLLGYLDRALPVLTSSATMADVLDPERPAVVPLTFRTDGRWIWTDTVGYYLERYALAPDEALLAHLRSVGPDPAPVSEVALHRVLSFLQRPDDSEPVWVVPENDEPWPRPATV